MKWRALNVLCFFLVAVPAASRADQWNLCRKSKSFVKRFLEIDFKGGRLKANKKVDAMLAGPEQPGWDSAAVINSYRIQSCSTDGTEAVVTVAYDVAGFLSSSSMLERPDFSSESHFERHRFHVSLRNGRLRLTDAANFKPHVSIEAAVADVQDLERDNPDDPAVTRGAKVTVAHLRATRGNSRRRSPASVTDSADDTGSANVTNAAGAAGSVGDGDSANVTDSAGAAGSTNLGEPAGSADPATLDESAGPAEGATSADPADAIKSATSRSSAGTREPASTFEP